MGGEWTGKLSGGWQNCSVSELSVGCHVSGAHETYYLDTSMFTKNFFVD